MKLLGSTKNKISKYENGENVPHLEIYEVALFHCNIVCSDYQQDLTVLCAFFPIKNLVNYQIFHPKVLYVTDL